MTTARHLSAWRRQRRGGLTVEMVLVVVVLAIVTVAVVQFGVFYANADQVALAARAGALEASQSPGLDSAGAVPPDVIRAIEHQLESSHIAWRHIRLEHNSGADGVLESEQGPPGSGACEPKSVLAESPLPGTEYVRLTVCVPLSQIFPKQLSLFGKQLFPSDKTYEHTAVFRYEL